MKIIFERLRKTAILWSALPILAISGAQAATEAKSQDLGFDDVVTGVDLFSVTQLVERQGLEVAPLDDNGALPVYMVVQTADDGSQRPLMAFGFLGCPNGGSPEAVECPVLRLASVDLTRFWPGGEAIAANATFEAANEFNTKKIGTPFFFMTGVGGLYLRSDLDMRAGVTLRRVDFHFGEFARALRVAVQFMAQAGDGDDIAAAIQNPNSTMSFATTLTSGIKAKPTAKPAPKDLVQGVIAGQAKR